MLPDYIIYDELKKERAKQERLQERPRLEIPRYPVYQPEHDHQQPEMEEKPERGVAIIQF